MIDARYLLPGFFIIMLGLLFGCTESGNTYFFDDTVTQNLIDANILGASGQIPYINADGNALQVNTNLDYNDINGTLRAPYLAGNGSLITGLSIPPGITDTNIYTAGIMRTDNNSFNIDINSPNVYARNLTTNNITYSMIGGKLTDDANFKRLNNPVGGGGLAINKNSEGGGTNALTIRGADQFIATGLTSYINTSKVATGTNTTYITDGLAFGDSVSFDADFTHNTYISHVTSETQFETYNNNLGYDAGTDKTLYVRKALLNIITNSFTPTSGVLPSNSLLIDYAGAWNIPNQSLTLGNGYTYGCAGNCYFSANSGSGYLYSNGSEVARFTYDKKFMLTNSAPLIIGSDGAGGAGGGTKTEGVIRGSTNGGSSNGGGTPLNFQVSALGNNATMYQKWTIGEPTTSGTGAQTQLQRMKLTYNLLDVNVNTQFDFNVTATKSLAVGTNTLTGLNTGDINATTIYYDTLTAKSPIFLCSQNGEIKNCMVIQPEIQKIIWLDLDKEYNIIGDKSKLDTAITAKAAKMVTEKYINDKIAKAPPYSKYNSVLDTYVYDPILECESKEYQYWEKGICKINEQRKCSLDINSVWDYTSMSCKLSPAKICANAPGYEWIDNNCIFNKDLIAQIKMQECFNDITKIWNGTLCINAN